MSIVPPAYAESVGRMFGEAGAEWAAALPTLLGEIAGEWGLDTLEPIADLSINFVAYVRCGELEGVLKAGPPNPEIQTELAALDLFGGGPCVRLVRSDLARGIMLLERLRPGTPLTDWITRRDDEATIVGADLMRRLWRSAPESRPFPTLADWASGLRKLRPRFDGGTGPFPPDILDAAEGLFRELLAEPRDVLLHGDLHHGNILAARREPWLVIDPKGVVGDPAYEAATFMASRGAEWGSLELTAADLERRSAILSERLSMDRSRLLDWALARTVLSAWWCIEGQSDGFEDALELAETLSTLR